MSGGVNARYAAFAKVLDNGLRLRHALAVKVETTFALLHEVGLVAIVSGHEHDLARSILLKLPFRKVYL